MKKIILPTFSLLFLIMACEPKQSNSSIVLKSDYAHLLQAATNERDTLLQSDIHFWSDKLKAAPNNITYLSKLAAAYSRLFKAEGNVEYIFKADSLYALVESRNPFSNAATYQALGVNAITRHQFVAAKNYGEAALLEGDMKSASFNLIFDASMEVGDYDRARSILNGQIQRNSFQYLIRASKLADHDGNLELAIELMEKAHARVKNHPELSLWSLSNLGDLYGHAGRIADSYGAYLDVLQKDPTHWHSWQGIAWILYSHEGKVSEAEVILQLINQKHHNPELNLLLADLADYSGKKEQALKLRKQFYTEVSQPKYGHMYSKYLILLDAEDLNSPKRAVARAEAEKDSRPTPEVYSLLAWAKLHNGEKEEALRMAQQFVEDKTSEPEAVYHLGMIYKANGKTRRARQLLKEANDAAYELGPITAQAIEKALKSF
ncbi:tetratricopeptide repeat protein [Roseivirga thermotolerans]|uniref:tetratricopeptide repeat protein n=1 Tax=Roseivirga thermotolerans TaxID=1758176 RepID=UPI00167B894C|nr:tetratricopeptide repeat protein [Roseivirga thermotolerans]